MSVAQQVSMIKVMWKEAETGATIGVSLHASETNLIHYMQGCPRILAPNFPEGGFDNPHATIVEVDSASEIAQHVRQNGGSVRANMDSDVFAQASILTSRGTTRVTTAKREDQKTNPRLLIAAC